MHWTDAIALVIVAPFTGLCAWVALCGLCAREPEPVSEAVRFARGEGRRIS